MNTVQALSLVSMWKKIYDLLKYGLKIPVTQVFSSDM
jgi:hypothetical protein